MSVNDSESSKQEKSNDDHPKEKDDLENSQILTLSNDVVDNLHNSKNSTINVNMISAEERKDVLITQDIKNNIAHYQEKYNNDVINIEPSTSSTNNDNNSFGIHSNKNSLSIDVDVMIEENYDRTLVTVDLDNNITHSEEDFIDNCQKNDDNESSTTSLLSNNSNDDQIIAHNEFGQGKSVTQCISQLEQVNKLLNSITIPSDDESSDILPIGDRVAAAIKSPNAHIGDSKTTNINAPVTIIYKKAYKSDIEYKQNNVSQNKDKNDQTKVEQVTDKQELSTPLYSINSFPTNKVKHYWTRQRMILVCGAMLILIIITVLSILLSNILDSDSMSTVLFNLANTSTIAISSTTSSILSSTTNDLSSNNDDDFRIITRKEWGAWELEISPTKLKILPPTHVIISHTDTNVCLVQEKCIQILLCIQEKYKFKYRSSYDFDCNFYIGGDGNVYEGRGWNVEAFPNIYEPKFKSRSICISFIGNFTAQNPTKAQIYATAKLLKFAAENNKVIRNYKLLPAKEMINTKVPGIVFYIRTPM